MSNNKMKTTAQFEKELQDMQGINFIVSSKYQGANKPIKITCTLCGHETTHTPSALLRKGREHNCSLCEFKTKLLDVAGDTYVYHSGFQNYVTPVTVTHTTCGSKLTRIPTDFIRKNRPPSCDRCRIERQTKTHSWFVAKVAEVSNNEYTIHGVYTSAKKKVSMTHKSCGKSWEYSPDNFIRRGARCPHCANNAKLTTTTFCERLANKYGNEFTVVSEYVNARKPLTVKHNRCGYIREVTPYALLNSGGCPVCNSSLGESLVRTALKNLNLYFEEQKVFKGCQSKGKLRFDFYIPGDNVCIEYNGLQHYECVPYFHGSDPKLARTNFAYQQKRDAIKKSYCQQNGITLICIPYTVTQLFELTELIKAVVDKESKAENPTPKGRVMI